MHTILCVRYLRGRAGCEVSHSFVRWLEVSYPGPPSVRAFSRRGVALAGAFPTAIVLPLDHNLIGVVGQ